MTFVTHGGDLVAGFDFVSDADAIGMNVTVDGNFSVSVLYAYPLAIALRWAGADNGAVHDRVNGGANSVPDIDALVHPSPAHAVW